MTSSHAFVDESGKGSSYYVCAALTAAHDAAKVRQLAQSHRLRGQRRWHFTKESDARRSAILSSLIDSDLVRARVYFGKGNDALIRAEALRAMTKDLLGLKVDRLIIESRAARDDHDRRVLFAALRSAGGADLVYEHMTPAADPALWFADAVAWSYSAGGRWQSKLATITDHVQDLGRL
jgi:hypothetical protein